MRFLFLLLFAFFNFVSFSQTKNYSLEFNELFPKNTNHNYVSVNYNVNSTNTIDFQTLSAYSLDMSVNTKFYYRYFSKGEWHTWRELKEDKEAVNSKRKVFGLETIVEKIDKIQFKSSKRVANTTIFRLFFAVKNAEETTHITKEANETLNCDLPNFCDRSCWCPSGDCNPQSAPYPTDVTHIIVHHSATNYSAGTDYAQVVYSYWDYHVNTHGWNDIGYNWLVDPNGVLYEGRGDGIQGAHFSCMNGHTMGVCVIGNFETATPTTQAIAMLEDLIAWETTDKGLDVLANTYHSPSQLNLYTVSGHKDGNPSPVGCPSGTLCPGTNLYSELASIRTDVSGFPCYITASTEENINIDTVKVYPNPVKSILNIDALTPQSLLKVAVYNAFGVQIAAFSKDIKTIDLTRYSSGIYFVRIIQNDTTSLTFKIIKE